MKKTPFPAIPPFDNTAAVLIPGFMLTRDLWNDVLSTIHHFETVIYADINAGNSIEKIARSILKTAPPKFTLIGFSMGGYIAREITRIAPERVSSLILISTSSRGDNDLYARRKSAVTDISPEKFTGISRQSIRQSLAPSRENDVDLIERIHAMSVEAGVETFQKQASTPREGDIECLSDIKCPTLIIAGRHDRLRGLDEAEELHSGIYGSKIVILEAGHMIPLEAPTELEHALVDFLTEKAAISRQTT